MQKSNKLNYEYSVYSIYGGYMPYVVYLKSDSRHLYPFHISAEEFEKLHDNGCGRCYGRTEWGPWRILTLFRYIIYGNEPVTDEIILKRLDDKLNAFFESVE